MKTLGKSNHMNLDLGTHHQVYLRRDWIGGVSTQTKPSKDERKSNDQPSVETGQVVQFSCGGQIVDHLAPKKNELDLWSVTIRTSNGVHLCVRLDMIIASIQVELEQPAPEPGEPGDHVEQPTPEPIEQLAPTPIEPSRTAPLEGEHIPA